MDVLTKELCALKFRKCIQNLEKNILSLFTNQDGKNAHLTSNLVYCSVKCLFCFTLNILNVQEVPQ